MAADIELMLAYTGGTQGNGAAAREACRLIALYLEGGRPLPPSVQKWLAEKLYEIGTTDRKADDVLGLRRHAQWTRPVPGYTAQIERDRHIWQLREEGVSVADLADRFSLSEPAIEKILQKNPLKANP